MLRRFIILLFLPSWIMAVDYCSICSGHTMCRYKGPGLACGHNKTSGVSVREIQEILTIHNNFRSTVALGKEKRGKPGPQPSSANMNALIWDDNLAQVAQRWADQCTFQHDICRQDPRFQVGQNIFFARGYSTLNWTQAISAWYQEVTKFDSRTVDKYSFEFTTGHYTQLVWGTTRYIGCGKTSFNGFYRAADYEQEEYILSSVPQNQSLTNDHYLSKDVLTSDSHLLENVFEKFKKQSHEEKTRNSQHFLSNKKNERFSPHTRVRKWTEEEWRSSIFNNLGKSHIVVCNYGPSGNFLSQPIYIRGEHCSKCPFGSWCINGLCT